MAFSQVDLAVGGTAGAWRSYTIAVNGIVGDVRFGRPDEVVAAGAWSYAGGATSLFDAVDEATESDTDYIYTTTPNNVVNLGLSPIIDPATSSNHVLRIRAKSTTGSTLTVRLKQGTTTIATRTFPGITSSFVTYVVSLSGAETDAITDYTALRVELEAA